MAKKSRAEIFTAAAEALELPADVVAGAPRIELIGRHEFRMENHRGILAYGREEISVSGGRMFVIVRGHELEIAAMGGGSLFITGNIESVILQ